MQEFSTEELVLVGAAARVVGMGINAEDIDADNELPDFPPPMMPPPPPKPLNGKAVVVEVEFDLSPPDGKVVPNNLDVEPDPIIVDDDAGAGAPILVPPKLKPDDALPPTDRLTLPVDVDGVAEDAADAPKPENNGRDDAVVVGGAADAADADDGDGNDVAKDEPNILCRRIQCRDDGIEKRVGERLHGWPMGNSNSNKYGHTGDDYGAIDA